MAREESVVGPLRPGDAVGFEIPMSDGTGIRMLGYDAKLRLYLVAQIRWGGGVVIGAVHTLPEVDILHLVGARGMRPGSLSDTTSAW